MTEVFDAQQGITGELRQKLAEYEPQEIGDEFIAHPIGEVGYDIMMALCDSIDAVHANLERENAELRDELRRIKKDGDDGGVKPPKGADDAPIRIGDAMVLQHEAKEKPYVVQSLTWDGEDWYFTCDEGLFNVCGWEHYHAPTVEDVLREFAHVGIRIVAKREFKAGEIDLYADEEAIAEFAAKLRLAGDES